ncbi:MAG: CDP-alcohol phosphatidyltransferase family protein [Actinomycetota bacterium]|nr:CDP-alcohol phosphatidyltransferase family protein [Actinomycetota bacterium]
MLERFRQYWTSLLAPVADALVRAGVSPDLVTLVGTLGVSAGALIFFPLGMLWVGVLVIGVFVFADLIDGYMARSSGRSSQWGAWLDSTLDRVGDAAIFGGLVLWFAGGGDDPVLMSVALWCLVMGSLTSYARARAEGLGMQAKGGIAERADRLAAVLLAAFFADALNLEVLLAVTLWVLAVASTVTVGQRALAVRRQAVEPAGMR